MRTFEGTTSDTRRRARVFATVALAAAMVLMMVVPSYGATTVNLHTPHVGASSTTFNNEADDGGLSAAVVWHFVLNGLDRGTPAAQLTVTFAGAGTSVVNARVVGQGQTQHFYVGTSGHDTLVGAYAVSDSEGTGNLVLSHVSYDQVEPPVDEEPPDEEEPPVDDPPVDDPPVDDPPVDDPPVDDPPVDDPPVDDPPADDPPVDDPPADDPPADDPPADDPPADEEDPFLPFTPQPEVDPDPFLPYTGFDSMSLLAAAGWTALGGGGLRLAARRRRS